MSKVVIAKAMLLALVSFQVGCQQLPGSPETQGTVIGGASGAAIGAAVGGEDDRLLGALLGGAIGAGAGYVVGANKERILGRDEEAATEAVRTAQVRPATPAEALRAETADLNADGFVTLDEVIAMEEAGLTDDVILQRLEATGQVFELSEEQMKYLLDRGVSRNVVLEMADINVATRQELLNAQQEIIGRPAQPVR